MLTISILKMFSSCSPGPLVNPLVAETAIRGRYSVCCWEHFWSEEERAGVADGSGPRPSQAKKTPILSIVVPKSERRKIELQSNILNMEREASRSPCLVFSPPSASFSLSSLF